VLPSTGGRDARLTHKLQANVTYFLKRRITFTCTLVVNVLALSVCCILCDLTRAVST
jgi:hypothetical protein